MTETYRKWAEKNKTKLAKKYRLWAEQHPEECKIRSDKYKKNNPDKVKECARKIKQRLKTAALIKYSDDPPRCMCCGETTLEFLTIDHINGGGNIHRKSEKNSTNIYQWLKTNGYPEGFQTLCMNCNWAKGVYGLCPHQKT